MKLLSLILSVALLLGVAAAAPYEAVTIPDSCQELAIPDIGSYPLMNTKLDEENEVIYVWLDRAVDYLAVNFQGKGPIVLDVDERNDACYSTRNLKSQAGIVSSTLVYTGIEYTKASFEETDPDIIKELLYKNGELPLEEDKDYYDYVVAETDKYHWGIYLHYTYGDHAYTVSWQDKTVFYDRAGNPLTIYQVVAQDLFNSNMECSHTVIRWEKNGNTNKWYPANVTASYTDSRITSISANYLPNRFQDLYRISAMFVIGTTTYNVEYDSDNKFTKATAYNQYGSYKYNAGYWYNVSSAEWFRVRDFSLVPVQELTFTRLR